MKFSVLIAHYNNADFFKDCFASLQKQTYPFWEAIILDDASEENEKNKVKKIIENDPRFHYYENTENKGVGITKAKLIDLSQGEICGFVDPDDALLPEAIQQSVDEFRKNKNVVLTYSRFMTCDENLNAIAPFRSARQVPNDDLYFFNYPIQIAHFVTFRKEVYLETLGMDTTKKIAEDQDLYLKMYEKGNVKFINETNYLYRTHAGGISQNDNKNKSYEFWAEVIFNAMKRRGLNEINGKKIPEKFNSSEEIFNLLTYQNSILYRIKKKIKTWLQ